MTGILHFDPDMIGTSERTTPVILERSEESPHGLYGFGRMNYNFSLLVRRTPMEEELRKAFSKKEKIELFISKLDVLKQEGSLAEAQYLDLKAEYEHLLEETLASIKALKAKARKEFEKKARELEDLQKDHDMAQARLNVGEIRTNSYLAQIRPVKKAIDQLKKEVPKLRVQATATSSAEIGGPIRVEIPELKIGKIRKKPVVAANSSRKP